MTTSTITHYPDTSHPATSKVLRTIGIGGIGYAVSYGTYLAANFTLNKIDQHPVPEYPTPDQMAGLLPNSAALAIVFAANGLFALVAFGGIATLLTRAGSTVAGAASALGTIIGLGVIGAGIASVVQSGFVNEYIEGSGADDKTQLAVVQALFVLPQHFAAVFGVAFGLWAVLTAFAGRDVLPKGFRIAQWPIGVVSLGTLFVGFSAGIVLLIPYLLALGIWGRGHLHRWGRYAHAVAQWERITGREAPAPALLTDSTGPRPAPEFVEWLMGIPTGWVTSPALGLTPNQQITALGNGVLPLQAIAAIRSACLL